MSQLNFNLVNVMSQFYQQIAMVKRWIVHDQLALEAKAILKLQVMPNDEEIATAISLHLSQWLGDKRLYWQDKLTERQRFLLDKAYFAMTALADELFILELDWVGRDHWHQVLLEEHFYDSCSAGGIFYRQLDALLADDKYQPLEVQLAAVYLLTLRLGFVGRYREDTEILKDYRQKLFKVITQHQSKATAHIHGQAYEHCLVSQQEQRLAPLSNWYRGAIYSVGLYLIIGVVVWLLLNQGLDTWLLT
ncbi:DotU family type IV/VI secretion system protein [Marinomonas transparens]|uniref:DotU family type IV/VI secretion system protein n=1 Tax=Marinomonas transparens TaxID=2795388 RepID=A0A934JU47_9GAMM|nr:DotU family type IV/VI secretion system protein [Marinomonas transparens]MBJ7540003.1 DotU family type IV/VI secretion system protein [Marinomonas transparens]